MENNDAPKHEKSLGSIEWLEEYQIESFNDSWRVNLSKKMPADLFLTYDKSTNGLRRKSFNMMSSVKPAKPLEKSMTNNSHIDNSTNNIVQPLMAKINSKWGKDTFIYHNKANQEISDTKNLFNYLENGFRPRKPLANEPNRRDSHKSSTTASFKEKIWETPSELSDDSPTSYMKCNNKSKKIAENSNISHNISSSVKYCTVHKTPVHPGTENLRCKP